MSPLLSVRNLNVQINEQPILHRISLELAPGEVHVLLEPNGAGKSTLGNVIMGNPAYSVTDGEMLFNGMDLLPLSVDQRAQAGIFLSFQNPLEVPGISLFSFLKSAYDLTHNTHERLWTFRKQLSGILQDLAMDESYLDRDLNVGFSGGEKKKAEILQMLTLNPKLAILDETDSGLDVDAVKAVSHGVARYMEDAEHTLLIITHSTRILESLHVDRVHILAEGHIVYEGDASLIDEINTHGFERYLSLQ